MAEQDNSRCRCAVSGCNVECGCRYRLAQQRRLRKHGWQRRRGSRGQTQRALVLDADGAADGNASFPCCDADCNEGVNHVVPGAKSSEKRQQQRDVGGVRVIMLLESQALESMGWRCHWHSQENIQAAAAPNRLGEQQKPEQAKLVTPCCRNDAALRDVAGKAVEQQHRGAIGVPACNGRVQGACSAFLFFKFTDAAPHAAVSRDPLEHEGVDHVGPAQAAECKWNE